MWEAGLEQIRGQVGCGTLTVRAPTPTQFSHTFRIPVVKTQQCVFVPVCVLVCVGVIWSPWNVPCAQPLNCQCNMSSSTWYVCCVVNREWQSLLGWGTGLFGLAFLIVLPHLHLCVPSTEILRGGVKIIQNKYLSYAPQVNWLDIVKDGTAQIVIEDNGPESECTGL